MSAAPEATDAMESLNKLIQNLGANRVNLKIVANEFEQRPLPLRMREPNCSFPDTSSASSNAQDALDIILNACGKATSVLRQDICSLNHATVKLTKKQKEAVSACLQGDRLQRVNNSLLEYLSGMLEINIVIVFVDKYSGRFATVFTGLHASKNETQTCFAIAHDPLEVAHVRLLDWHQVKEQLFEKRWVDGPLVTSKWMSAADVKSLANWMDIDSKGFLKKDLIVKICDTLQKN